MKTQKSFDAKKLYIQSLINSMQDVLDLAEEHGLTGTVHYGTQLQKIINLLDSHLQDKWYEILAQNVVAKPNRWNRMILFLNEKLKIFQIRASEEEEYASEEKKSAAKEPPIPAKKESGGGAYHAATQCNSVTKSTLAVM